VTSRPSASLRHPHVVGGRIGSIPSNRDPVDFVERNLIAGPVIELGRARTFVRRHRLCIFERAAVVEIGRNPRGAKRMAAHFVADAGVFGAAADHTPDIDPVHRRFRQLTAVPARRAEKGRPLCLEDPRRQKIGVEIGLQIMMRRHLVQLAAFLAQAHPLHRLDIDQFLEAAGVRPGEEAPASAKVGFARVGVFDGDGEEFQKAPSLGTRGRPGAKRRGRSPAASIRLAQGLWIRKRRSCP